MPGWQRAVANLVLAEPIYGAYTTLFAACSQEICGANGAFSKFGQQFLRHCTSLIHSQFNHLARLDPFAKISRLQARQKGLEGLALERIFGNGPKNKF